MKEIASDALAFASEFNKYYFEAREIPFLLDRLDPEIIWIDAGQAGLCSGLEAVRRSLELKGPEFNVHFLILEQRQQVSVVSEGMALVSGELEMRRVMPIPNPTALRVRFTYGIRRIRSDLRLAHLHLSLPNEQPAEFEQETPKNLENEARFRFALEASNDMVFEWDLDRNKISADREKFHTLFQTSRDDSQAEDPLSAIMKMIHPEDIISVQNLFRPETLKKEVYGHAQTKTLDFRIKGGRSHYVWVRGTLIPIQDRAGSVSRAIGIFKNVDINKRLALEMQRKSQQDAMTGIYNRGYTEFAVNQYFFEAGKSANAALMMIDVDDFKQVNDTYGHLYGDNVLREITKKMTDLFKSPNILGRIGGDEFVVFVVNPLSMDWIEDKAWLLIEKFAEAFAGQHPRIKTSCSVGIAFAPLHGSDFQSLLEKADVAMYQAKRHGKNCYCIWDAAKQA